MYAKAMELRQDYIQNGTHYNVFTNNCNQNVQMILAAGGKQFATEEFDWIDTMPNWVYLNMIDKIRKGEYSGYLYGNLSDLGIAYMECTE